MITQFHMDLCTHLRWVATPFDAKRKHPKSPKPRETVSTELPNSIPLQDDAADPPAPAPTSPILHSHNNIPDASTSQTIINQLSSVPMPSTPADTRTSNLENVLSHLPIPKHNHHFPSRSHGYKTKFSGTLQRIKGTLIGDWEMQLRGEVQLLDGEAELTAYRLLKHGYQPDERVCG
ncbi:hypothetical protein K7432_016410 [Basidiobolus ranarum]|uniref:Uncharacterized protein n=1 Tax=Basidiobolus ranarum TaxID=34480 RepID=A0ABR2WER8_9FUNG